MLSRTAFAPRHKNAGRPAHKSARGFLQWLRGRNCLLADRGGGVGTAFQDLGDGDGFSRERVLPFGLEFLVVTDRGVAAVEAREERAARRRADGAAGVEVREARAAMCEGVEARRADTSLSVDAKVAGPEVVGENEQDVGRTGEAGAIA